MVRRAPLFAFAVLLSILAAPAEGKRRAASAPRNDLTPVEWLQAAAAPFRTTEARSGTADLAPLHPIVGDARIVSLGEATHGSREFFTMKHRVLEFLVEQKGFTVFAIEANLPEADRVDDYVLHGTGDPRTALAGMYFWTWNTAEVLDMIEWMREYNLRRGDKPPVRFRGFDAQFAHYAVEEVEKYVARVEPARAAELASKYDCIRGRQRGLNYRSLPATTRNQCFANVTAVHELVSSQREAYTSRSSADEYERLLRYALVVVQTESVWSNRVHRDTFMARNVEWLGEVLHPGEKMVLWAHNWHVSTAFPVTMGTHLRNRYGRDMVVMGFAFDRGGFTANGPSGRRAYEQPTGPLEGWEPFLRQAGHARYFIDLRRPFSAQAASYLAVSRNMWIIGASWDPAAIERTHRWSVSLPNTFDVVIYIETVTATQLL